MKLAVPNLKTLDYKQLGIDHGEKLAIAIVGLMLLGILWATKWTHPIKESPTELIDEATAADEKIKKQPWPDGDVKLFNTGENLSTRVTSLLTPLDVNAWKMPVVMNKPYHPDRALISRPKWLAVQDLVADAQAVDLEMDRKVSRLNEGFKKLKKEESSKSDKAKKAEKGDKDKEAEDKEKDPMLEELKRNTNPGGGGIGGIGPGGIGGFGKGIGGGFGMGRGRGRGRGPGDSVTNLGRKKGRRSKKRGDEDSTVAVANQKPIEKPVGRGYHIVAIRGVFPLREQVAELRRAMGNSVTAHDAQELIQMHDFTLMRQVAKPGPDPWSGPWEKVDRESTLEMFHNDIYSFAPETVLASIVDNHICMPLPVRLIGVWGHLATHKLVKEFVLSPDEVQAQLEYQRKIIDKMKEEEEKKKAKDDKGGFAEFTNNPRNVRRRAAQGTDAENSKPIQDQIVEDLQKAAKDRPSEADINAKLTDFITKHASPQDHLLLFRYVDFTVEPGKIYRYKVQLTVENPFHNRHPEEVSDPSLIERETRDTEWSEPTNPVYVPEDARFFVTHVAAAPGRNSLPRATVDLYQWFASTGTIVNKAISAQIGQVFGGLEVAKVLDPAQGTSESEKVPFSTSAALVDMAPGFSLDTGLHKDLIAEMAASDTKDKPDPQEKKAAEKEKRNTGTMVPEVLVFVDANGALRMIDGLDQEEDHQAAKHFYTLQNEQYEDLNKPDDEKPGRGRGRFGMAGRGKSKRGPRGAGPPGK